VNFKVISALAAGLGFLSAAPAFAAVVTVDFDGVGSFAGVQEYYNGGTDWDGNSGPNYGVSFAADVLGLSNGDDPTGPFYSNAPSPAGVMFVAGAEGAMNVAAGFVGTASFSYSLDQATTVNIYSGLNGTGDILGSFELAANSSNGGCSGPYCFWSVASVDFAGLAHSIQFANGANIGGFDNVTVNAVPLPAAAWLLASALGGMGVFSRRKRAA
jgi:hypothetical protein